MKNPFADDILSAAQYAEIEKSGFKIPYIVEVENSGQKLLFYGSKHTNDPKHPQFGDIEERWQQFIAKSNNPIALVEGRFDEVSKNKTIDKTKSIIGGGESQFLVHLARKSGVEVKSPEPDRVWEANELAKEFGRNSVVFYYFIRQVDWRNRLTEKPDIKAEAKRMLQLMQKTFQWDDVEFSIKRMAELHEELLGSPMSWDDTQWLNSIISPTPKDYITNELARKSGDLRDQHIFEQILGYWREGRSIFAVYGSAHAIKLEPALRKLAT